MRRSRPASQDWGVARNSSLSAWLSSAPHRRRAIRLAVAARARSGASVTTAEGKSRQEIQDELDAIVRDNMMTISVAPVAQLQEDGKLRVNVQNVQDNKFPQRFRVIQNDETMYESGVSRPARQSRRAPPATSKKARHTSRSRHSMPRPSTATAIRHVSRYGLSKPRTSFFGRRGTARNSPAFVQSCGTGPRRSRKERPWTSPGT